MLISPFLQKTTLKGRASNTFHCISPGTIEVTLLLDKTLAKVEQIFFALNF